MRLLLLSFFSLILITRVFADTIVLKNGQTINGKILERNKTNIKIEVQGIAMTYYMDEIQSMPGDHAVELEQTTPGTASAPLDDTQTNKRDLILKFIDVFGTRRALTENLQSMLESLPKDDAQAQKLAREIKVDEIIDRLVPVYDKQFSESDLKDFIAFYSSPAGQKLTAGIAKVMQESVEVSGNYFQEKLPPDDQEDNN